MEHAFAVVGNVDDGVTVELHASVISSPQTGLRWWTSASIGLARPRWCGLR